MSIFKQVSFKEIYTGNLPASVLGDGNARNYCSWFTECENDSSTTSQATPASAFGLYSAEGFISCKQAQDPSGKNGLLNRYTNDDPTKALTFNFVIAKRKSNFLVPILLGTKLPTETNDQSSQMISLIAGQSEDDSSRLYKINSPSGKLNGYNPAFETTRSFLTDSVIIQTASSTAITTFSIFHNIVANPTVFNSEDNTDINIVFPKNSHDDFFRKNLSITDLNQQFKFYKYKINFQGNTISSMNAILEEYTPTSISSFLTEVKNGNIYATKESVLNDSTYVRDPFDHPIYTNATITLKYWDSKRTTVLATKVVNLSGQTLQSIKYTRFYSSYSWTLRYGVKDFTKITAFGNNSTFITVSSTSDKFYYPGGKLLGWTLKSLKGFRNGRPNLSFSEVNDFDSETDFKAGTTINATVLRPITVENNVETAGNLSFYYTIDGTQKNQFYFSNKNNTFDDSTISHEHWGEERIINLYPLYVNDPDYLPDVVEISPRRNLDISEQYITLRKDGFDDMLATLRAYPVIDAVRVKSEGIQKTHLDGKNGIRLDYGDPNKFKKSDNSGWKYKRVHPSEAQWTDTTNYPRNSFVESDNKSYYFWYDATNNTWTKITNRTQNNRHVEDGSVYYLTTAGDSSTKKFIFRKAYDIKYVETGDDIALHNWTKASASANATINGEVENTVPSSFIIEKNDQLYRISVTPPTLEQVLGTGSSNNNTTKFLRQDGNWSNMLRNPTGDQKLYIATDAVRRNMGWTTQATTNDFFYTALSSTATFSATAIYYKKSTNNGYSIAAITESNFESNKSSLFTQKTSVDFGTYYIGNYEGSDYGTRAYINSYFSHPSLEIDSTTTIQADRTTLLLRTYSNLKNSSATSFPNTDLRIVYDYNSNLSNTGGFNNYNKKIYTADNTVFKATKVFNAVFNDYAEYRTTINLKPGRVVIDNDDGSLSCSSSRLQPGAQVISDTFGHSMGETNTAKTPLAVAGRVLVYPYQLRENYHAGMAVCSAPDGTVDIMTREEIRDYPDCIIGIVSEIPQYEVWGSDNVKVDGRIWIKVK